MTVLSLILMALSILKAVLPQLTNSAVPGEVIDAVKGAIEKLESVKGSPVTQAQLESLRLEKLW